MEILFLLLTNLLLAIAAYSSAVQDIIAHKFEISIFNNPNTTKKVFGFNKYWWYKSHWTNKWLIDKDGNLLYDKHGNRIPRTTKILFWKVQLLQIYDAWHFYKTIKIGTNILADIAASVAAVMIYIKYEPSITIWIILGFSYFILQSVVWVVVFNLFYDKLLISQ